MKTRIGLAALAFALAASPVYGQAPADLKGDLLKATNEVEEKLVALAGALTTEQYAWRPGPGVRSVQEVLLHVAADNYFIPAAMGIPAPAATKITATDYAAVQAFEAQQLDKDAIIAELRKSFVHLEASLNGIPESRMNEALKIFGQDFTVRGFMLLTVTHLHEHLGQMIAYARSNSVKPPWSR